MELDRYLLLALGLFFAGMSLFAPRALSTGRVGRGGVVRREDPALFWFSVLAPPVMALAALGHFAAGGEDIQAVTSPFILFALAFILVRALKTGRFPNMRLDRKRTPAWWAGVVLLSLAVAILGFDYVDSLLGLL